MKGAIGNAFIMNMVITFIVIFYMLLIGSMAYSKAYRVKNYILEKVVHVEESVNKDHDSRVAKKQSFIDELKRNVNDYLARVGYILRYSDSCPTVVGGVNVNNSNPDIMYKLNPISLLNEEVGYYDFCLYMKKFDTETDSYSNYNYNFVVLVYMKFDIPVLGNFIKIPITGETKTFRHLKTS